MGIFGATYCALRWRIGVVDIVCSTSVLLIVLLPRSPLILLRSPQFLIHVLAWLSTLVQGGAWICWHLCPGLNC